VSLSVGQFPSVIIWLLVSTSFRSGEGAAGGSAAVGRLATSCRGQSGLELPMKKLLVFLLAGGADDVQGRMPPVL
jgi:hypothetical protein